MFRLTRAEFKKIFLKPGIFVVTALLIIMLALSSFLYKTTEKEPFSVSINGTTVSEIYTKFEFESATTADSKNDCDGKLASAQSYIDYYVAQSTATLSTKESLKNDVENLKKAYASYNTAYFQGGDSDVDTMREALRQKFTNFKAKYNTEVVMATDKITVLTTTDINSTIMSILTTCDGYFGTQADEKDKTILSNLETFRFDTRLNEQLDKLIDFVPDIELVKSLSEKYIQVTETRLVDINNAITTFYSTGSNSTSELERDITKIKLLIAQYKYQALQAYNIVVKSIKVSALQTVGNAQDLTRFTSFSNANWYEMRENLTKLKYLFETNTYDYDYATSFSIRQASNQDINAYDFSFFALTLCSFIIIIYVVVLAAGTIAGEQSNGTLKLLAIRPYSRTKILFSKMFATLSVGTLLTAISAIVTLIIGGINYGFASAPILLVFNATTPLVMHPAVLYIIAFALILFQMLFFCAIALGISTIFKSNVGSVAISILIYFGTMVLNTVSGGIPFFGYFPLTCVNLFRFFGGSYLSTYREVDIMEKLLTPTVIIGSNFWVCLAIAIATCFLIIYSTYLIFRKRDIK